MKQALKLIGLSMLAVLSLAASTAPSAQASGEFRIGTPLKTFKEAGVASKSIVGTVGAGELLTTSGTKISCTKGTLSGQINSGGSVTVNGLFEGCKVASNKFCFVYGGLKGEVLSEEGMITASSSAEILLMEGKHFLLVASSEIAKFDIYGPLCPLDDGANPLKIIVSGSTVIELPDGLEDKIIHTAKTISHVILEGLFPNDQLFVGSEEAHLAAGTTTAFVELTSKENWGFE